MGAAGGSLSSWRKAGNETQLTKAFGEFAEPDSEFAGRLAECLLRAAAAGNRRAQQLLAKSVSVSGFGNEQRIGRVRNRGVLVRPRGGQTDWEFRADGFRLIVEVKLRARLGPQQLERYLSEFNRSAVDGGLLLLTQRLVDVPARVSRHGRWLGQVLWSEALPLLAQIAPSDPERAAEWTELIAVVRRPGDLGGDPIGWTAQRGMTAGRRNARLLVGSADLLVQQVRNELTPRHARIARDGVVTTRPGPRSRSVSVAGTAAWLTVYISGRAALDVELWGTRAPFKARLAVNPEVAGGRRAHRQAVVDRLAALGYESDDGWYGVSFAVAPQESGSRPAAVLSAELKQRVSEVVGACVFDGLVV